MDKAEGHIRKRINDMVKGSYQDIDEFVRQYVLLVVLVEMVDIPHPPISPPHLVLTTKLEKSIMDFVLNIQNRRDDFMARITSIFILIIFLFAFTSDVFADIPSDVPRDHWAYEAVDLLIREGIMKGYPDGTFKGNQNLTRYELAMIIYRVLELIKASGVSEEPKTDTKVQSNIQTAQPKESAVSFKRREIPTNAYTGLVINARGMKVGRSMSPTIYDVKGKEIYGPGIFTKESHSLEEYILLGVVEYIKEDGTNLEELLKGSSRAGSKPLIVKAIGTQGEFNDNIIISEEDGNLILRENENSKFLEDMAVVIVY